MPTWRCAACERWRCACASRTTTRWAWPSGWPRSPDHAVAQRLLGGCFGAMLAFDLKDAGRAEVFAFMEKLQIIQRIPSLGDTATLAAYPAHASHRPLTSEQRAALGIGDGCVRISAGIEALDDLIADLEQALA